MLVTRNKTFRKSNHACKYCMEQDSLICNTWTEIIAIILCTALFIIIALILVGLWLNAYKQGVFNLNGPTATLSPYNYMNRHALYMILACIGFASFGVAAFRMVFFCHDKFKLFLHIVLLIMATVFMILGYNYIHTTIGTSGIPDGKGGFHKVTHNYSIHSILGYLTFGLYAAACVMGFLVFKPPCKALFRGMHHGLGAVAYACGGLTVISGFTLRQQIQFGIAYIPYSKESIVCNINQLLIVMAVVLVLFMLARKEMKDVRAIVVADSDV